MRISKVVHRPHQNDRRGLIAASLEDTLLMIAASPKQNSTNEMNSEKIPFNRARIALKEGNPYPFLSRRVEFPPGATPSTWLRKSRAMFDTLESVRNRVCSARVADEVKQIFVTDPETRNLKLATRFLNDLLAACNAVSDEDYALFLAAFLPTAEIDEAVSTSRQDQDDTATHIRDLLRELTHQQG